MWTKRQRILISLICVMGLFSLYTWIPADIHRYTHRVPFEGLSHSWDLGEVQIPLLSSEHPQNTAITETTLPGGPDPAGFVILDRLYAWNGTLYAVTAHPEAFPNLKLIISKSKDRNGDPDTDPTPLDMQIISPEAAKPLLGEHAVVISGMSFILWDTKQYMAHYYHWWGELILGALRSYSRLALVPGVQSPLPEPKRFILAKIEGHGWRDPAGVNGPLMRAAWPDASIERNDFWNDLIKLNQTFVFERAMVISRSSAHRSPLVSLWHKMISSTMNATVPDNFWKPLQQRVVKNVVGVVPTMDQAGTIISNPPSTAPVVTYISRQQVRRSLTSDAHEGLMAALTGLKDEGLCELVVAQMENLTFSEQLEVASRTTIMLGVHGNGLTHQLWMPSSPRSTVIEIFFPETYLHDYSMLARNMGHKHYGIWNDTFLTYPRGKWFEGAKGGDIKDFNGKAIPVHGPTVADIIRERLSSFNS